MGPARTSATMWSAASPDGAVRGSRLDLPPLTVRSTSSVPRPDLPPHRRSCILLAVAAPLSLVTHPPALCYSSLNDRSSDATGAMWQWRNHPPTRPLACRPVNGLIKLQASTLTSPTLGGFFCSSPVQPGSTAAEPSSPKPVVSLLPKASPEIVIQAPPSASRWRGISCSRSQTNRTDARAGITAHSLLT
jgi:hypothetical protein